MVAPDDLERRKAATRLIVSYKASDVHECTVEKPATAGEIEHMELVAEWSSDLRANLNDEPLVIDARVGVFYSAVHISTGNVGVAFTPRDLNDTVCCPKTAAGAPPVGRLIGMKAWEIAEYALAPSALRRSLGIATLNALSAAAVDRYGFPTGTFREGLDALSAAQIVPQDRVVMVGSFIPFIKALRGRAASLHVVDKHPDALKADERALWVSPERAREALAQASVVIISGSALVEGGIDDLLSASKAARVRVMAGPTTPLWPRPFFRRGVSVLGGIRVLNPTDLLMIVGQGGSGYLFEKAAEKVCVIESSIDFLTAAKRASAVRPHAV
jgi:uncharacterized protein (DUF4213/DUF364 family)